MIMIMIFEFDLFSNEKYRVAFLLRVVIQLAITFQLRTVVNDVIEM